MVTKIRAFAAVGIMVAAAAAVWLTRTHLANPDSLFADEFTTRDFDTRVVTGAINLERATELPAPIDTELALLEAATAFLQREEVAAQLGLRRDTTFRVIANVPDPQRRGYRLARIEQSVGGLPVFGGEIAMSVQTGVLEPGVVPFEPPTGAISSLFARAATDPDADLTLTVQEDEALSTARAFYNSLGLTDRGGTQVDTLPERLFFEPARFRLGGEAAPAWRITIGGIEMFIHGRNRNVMFAYDTHRSARHRMTHDCRNTLKCPPALQDGSGTTPPVDTTVTAVHETAGIAYDYFKATFKRDGFDDTANGNSGKKSIVSYVRLGGRFGAFWILNPGRFEYGNGWAQPDIVGHEYAHAVNDHSSKLAYFSEPGAVTEFFADFFGAMIDRRRTGTLDWRIGEDVIGYTASRPMRNMANPNNGNFHPNRAAHPVDNPGMPDHYLHKVTRADPICKTPDNLFDNECVHFNSGILSRAAFLAVNGGPVGTVTIAPIAVEKVEQILFETWTAGVTVSSGLKETADIAIAKCRLMRGSHGIDDADCDSLAQAMAAVGLR